MFDSKADARLTYSITLKNFGTAAAQNVFAVGFPMVVGDIGSTLKMEKEARKYVENPYLGYVLFPGKQRVDLSSNMAYARKQMSTPNYRGRFTGYLIVCIGYRDQFSFLYYSTTTYELMNPQDTARMLEFDVKPDTAISGTFVPIHSSVE